MSGIMDVVIQHTVIPRQSVVVYVQRYLYINNFSTYFKNLFLDSVVNVSVKTE